MDLAAPCVSRPAAGLFSVAGVQQPAGHQHASEPALQGTATRQADKTRTTRLLGGAVQEQRRRHRHIISMDVVGMASHPVPVPADPHSESAPAPSIPSVARASPKQEAAALDAQGHLLAGCHWLARATTPRPVCNNAP
ncbi:hypothetical protein CC78DRAFT_542312 [Lojkania enalia]|uniref:Uncharacterized protein n=1 Tax=Lojkania enalia TaxID=147567 RepID=A0A9P4N579_9PLEO|nr:hypothetical protein CC78DRAFT_542312 [Didymosphaeria enalia]